MEEEDEEEDFFFLLPFDPFRTNFPLPLDMDNAFSTPDNKKGVRRLGQQMNLANLAGSQLGK